MHVQTLAQKCQIRSAAIGLRRGESALAPAGKGDAKTNVPDSGVQVEKAKLQPQGSKEHPDFILVSPPVDLTESFPQARPVRVILTLPTSIILPPALHASVPGSLVLGLRERPSC